EQQGEEGSVVDGAGDVGATVLGAAVLTGDGQPQATVGVGGRGQHRQHGDSQEPFGAGDRGSPMMSRPGTMLLASRMTPVVPRTGPLVRRLTWVPVAKISSAMRGMALSLNSAVVKLPMSSAAGAKVP